MSYNLENPHNLLELDLNFSLDEIRTQLELLNITNLTDKQLKHLKQDLDHLIENERKNILKSTIESNHTNDNRYQSNIYSKKSTLFQSPMNRNGIKSSINRSCTSPPNEIIISDKSGNDEENGDDFVIVCDDDDDDDGENNQPNRRQLQLHGSSKQNIFSLKQSKQTSKFSNRQLNNEFNDNLKYNDRINSPSMCWRKYLIENKNDLNEHTTVNENEDMWIIGDHTNQESNETKQNVRSKTNWLLNDLREIDTVNLMKTKNPNPSLQKKNKNESTKIKQTQIPNLSESYVNQNKNSFASHNSYECFVESQSSSPNYSLHKCDYESDQRLELEKLTNKLPISNNHKIELTYPEYLPNKSHFDSLQQNTASCSNSTTDIKNMVGGSRTVKKQIRSARFLDNPVEQVHNFGYTNPKPNCNGKNCLSTASKSYTTSLLSSLSNLPNQKSFNTRTRNQDPVSRYHSYQRSWLTHSVPGENARRVLRWNIKTAMMHREIPLLQRNCGEVIRLLGPHAYAQLERERQRHLKSLNLDYVPPTSRRYNDLRWSIRSALNSSNQPLSARF